MPIFINDAVFINNYPARIKYEKDLIRMSINLDSVSEEPKEYVEFEIPNAHGIEEGFNRNFCSAFSELVIENNKYIFKQAYNKEDNTLYLLVRAPRYSFGVGDVYISANDKGRVKVLKQFKFTEASIANKDKIISKMYFAKVDMPPKSGFAVYFSTVISKYKLEGIEFFNSTFFGVRFKKVVPILGFDEEMEKMYISLFDLSLWYG